MRTAETVLISLWFLIVVVGILAKIYDWYICTRPYRIMERRAKRRKKLEERRNK